MALQPFVGPWPIFSISWSFTQSVWHAGRGISPSQGLYLRKEQYKHWINTHNRDIDALSGISTHDHSVRGSEDGSCLRPRGHCDRQNGWVYLIISKKCKTTECIDEERDNNVETCEGRVRERGVDEMKWEGDSGIKMDHPKKSPDGTKLARTGHTRSHRPPERRQTGFRTHST
jgi:hypothetical protein